MASSASGASPEVAEDTSGVITKTSPRSVAETVSRFVEMLHEKEIEVFTVIDHSGEARRVGLDLRDTKLVVFGNPKAGTPVMQLAPLAALDLPLKVLVWDDDGQTQVSYTAPRTLTARYGLTGEQIAPLEVIGPLTDALVAQPTGE